MRSSSSRALAAVLSAAVAFASAAAPEHFHRADDHHDAVAHRHFQQHEAHRTPPGTVSDDDDHVVWLDAAALAQAAPAFDHSTAIVQLEVVGTAPPPVSWIATTGDESAPAHGPPRGLTAPRAPPYPVL
jgi:hypothetical protein